MRQHRIPSWISYSMIRLLTTLLSFLLVTTAFATTALSTEIHQLQVKTWLDDEITLLDILEAQNVNVTLINVWATWCPPCREELPLLLKQSQEGAYNLVTINLGDHPDQVAKYLFAAGLESLPTYFLSVRVGGALQLQGLPTTIVLNQKRELVRIHYGALNLSKLETLLIEVTR